MLARSSPAIAWRAVARNPRLGLLLVLIGVFALFFALSPDTFARPGNLVLMAMQTAVVAVCAVGMTMVIAHGGIDLSVGSTVALASVVIAWLLKQGYAPILAVSGGIATATACGLLNGLLITRLRVAPFIVTLGAMSLWRGVAKGVANEQKIDVDAHGLDALMEPTTLVAPGVWIALVIAAAAAMMLRYTRLGRHIFAVGSNEQAARLSGVEVLRVKVVVYTLAGALAGLAGLFQFARLTLGDPTDSVGLELSVIAAVVIGGASLSGGEGSIAGSLLGALLMTVIAAGGVHIGLPSWVQEIVTGVIIVLAVTLDRLRHRRL